VVRALLEQLEAHEADPGGGLAYLAGQRVPLDEDELRGALRRSLLLHATGGDPRRELLLDDRAVTALAADLDTPARREALDDGLAALVGPAAGLPRVAAALAELRALPELAWHWYALALVAGELAGEL
jgi:hypothetical protein